MNLQTIQKRIEELQAELLTVSNDLAYLIAGDVTRQPVIVGTPVTRFTELQEGDIIQIPHDFVDIDQNNLDAGSYKVASVERSTYSGYWDVEIEVSSESDTWVNFSTLRNVVKV